jgi:hypothetical protein
VSSDELIAAFELFALEGHLGLDVGGAEDVFEVHPLALGLHPLLHDLHDQLDVLRLLLGSLLQRLDVAIGQRVVDVRQRFIQDDGQLIHSSQHVASLLVRFDDHVGLGQGLVDLPQRFLKVPLLQSPGRYFDEVAGFLLHLKVEQFLQSQIVVLLIEVCLQNVVDVFDVFFLEILALEGVEGRQRLLIL